MWAYDPDAPSFRHRLRHVIPLLERQGWRCVVEQLPRGRYLSRILARRRLIRSSDLLVLSKIKVTPIEGPLLRTWAGRIVFDLDDAIHLRRPRAPGLDPERSWLRQAKFSWTCRLADLVTVGNRYLATEALKTGARVAVVPTPVDADHYPASPERCSRRAATVVWIGMPENIPYLDLVHLALARLSPANPDLAVRVVSSGHPTWTDVAIEAVPWSAATEVEALTSATIGLMPLTDDDWTRGKCAFKLLQYMAAGLPCVASPVGANSEVITHGVNGFLASTVDEWEAAIGTLLRSADLRARMGEAGRRRVLESYDRRVVGPRMARQLTEGNGSGQEDEVHR